LSDSKTSRVVGFLLALAAGIIVQFFFRAPVAALLTFLVVSIAVLFFLADGLPVRVSLDRSPRRLLGYDACYDNQEAAAVDIVKAAHSTQRLDVKLIRGHSFVLDEESLLGRMLSENLVVKVRILLLSPEGASMQLYLSKLRLSGEEKNEYLTKCSMVRDKLERLKATYDLEYKYYDFFPTWKLILTDSRSFVAPYDTKSRGSRLPVAAYHDMGKPVFIAFSNWFNGIWHNFAAPGIPEK